MTTSELYHARRMTPDEAVATIPDGARICMALGVAQPPALLHALAARATAGRIDHARLYYLLSTAVAGQSVLQPGLHSRLRPMSLFHSGIERALDAAFHLDGREPIDLVPVSFSRVPALLCDTLHVDTLVTQVAPLNGDGEFSLATNIDYAHRVARSCERVIVEVNRNMPQVGGVATIPLSRVSAIVEHDSPLQQVPSVKRRPADDVIAGIIAELIDDGACLQMGIGAVPEAVCAMLTGHRHLGIHTELLTPGLMHLIQAGAVDNSRKAIHLGKSIFTFAMGDTALYKFLSSNGDVEGHPVEYVNDPAVIARNDNMVSVNATMEIDLQGACNSEVMNGRQYSAAGGQLDFVRGATASRGGKSIIACHSTAAGGTISRIVPRLRGAVTTPRNDTHIIVTEYGWADLRGKTIRERAQAMISLAHPRFRDDLMREAQT